MPVLRLLLIVLAAAVAAGDDAALAGQARAILADACFHCHGPDAASRKADLRLDTAAGLAAVLPDGRGRLVAPGSPERSALWTRIVHADPDERMPPARSPKTLSAALRETIRAWIAAGAAAPTHWAYAPLARVALPASRSDAWCRDDLDAFVLERLRAEKLAPAPEADRRTLIRRLSFDLTGLPPTPEEVDAFLADTGPRAYENVVDRLLASPHFGERLATWWLDLVRYADTTGYSQDTPIPVAPYRDWVVAAFNRDLPFDRFTAEQLAGDLLSDADAGSRVAVAYNRLIKTTKEGGAQQGEYRARYYADRVRNLGTVWLATTTGCAECHDHKFDPVSQREFYQLAAFFADILEQPVIGPPKGTQRVGGDAKVQARLDALDRETKAAGKDPKRLAEIARQRKELGDGGLACLTVTAHAPDEVRVLPRGNWQDESGAVVAPGVLAALPALAGAGPRPTRLDLARWLTARNQPLTPRVVANHLWRICFGNGLARVMDDFGQLGEAPSHGALLDHLAAALVDGGWKLKPLLRRLVCSAAYRMDSRPGAGVAERDPDNRLLARQSRVPLEAEMVRDQALAASGLLVRSLGGAPVFPYQAAGVWDLLNFPKRTYAASKGDGQWRRTLYMHRQRTLPNPALTVFDLPTREEACAARVRSNIPQQALALLNDPIWVEAARALAARVLRDEPSDAGKRLDLAMRLVLARPAEAEERGVLLALAAKHRAQYAADPTAAKALLAVGQAPVPAGIDAAELAAWTSVTRTLFNLHLTITRY